MLVVCAGGEACLILQVYQPKPGRRTEGFIPRDSADRQIGRLPEAMSRDVRKSGTEEARGIARLA